jgi:hypothetical protein
VFVGYVFPGCGYAMFRAVPAECHSTHCGSLFDPSLFIGMQSYFYFFFFCTAEAAALISPAWHTTSITLAHDEALYMHFAGTVKFYLLRADLGGLAVFSSSFCTNPMIIPICASVGLGAGPSWVSRKR